MTTIQIVAYSGAGFILVGLSIVMVTVKLDNRRSPNQREHRLYTPTLYTGLALICFGVMITFAAATIQ